MLPPTLFLVAIGAIGAISWLVPHWIEVPGSWRAAGAGLLIAGILVNIAAARQFRRLRTPIRPFDRSTVLVRDGVFRWSRNPMYAGLVAALVGMALLVASAEAVRVAFVYARVVAARFIDREERLLRERFGREYDGYQRSVRRWL